MSAIINAKAGYGWDTDASKADEKGLYLEGTVTKTIYVDEQKMNPAYIFWQCRVYSYATTGTDKFKYTVKGLLDSTAAGVASDDIYVAINGGSTLVTIEGYATGNVTVEFALTTTMRIYPMNETGV